MLETQTSFMRRAFRLVSDQLGDAIPLHGRFKELAWNNEAIQYGHPGDFGLGFIESQVDFYLNEELLCMTFSSADGDALITLFKDECALRCAFEALNRWKEDMEMSSSVAQS